MTREERKKAERKEERKERRKECRPSNLATPLYPSPSEIIVAWREIETRFEGGWSSVVAV